MKQLEPEIISEIQKFLSPYVSLCKRFHEEPSKNARLEFETTTRRTHGPVSGDRPLSTEVSAVFTCEKSEPPQGKFCVWKKRSRDPRIIHVNNFLVEPFQYPLLYPEGQTGWHLCRSDNKGKKLFLLKYTRCLLLSEDRFSRFVPLSETWLIDMYARIEGQRFFYFQNEQKKAQKPGGLRIGPMDGVQAAVEKHILRDETVQGEGKIVAGRIYLSHTFTSGPRYMNICYMDAMALVSRLGGPTYFPTFTACGAGKKLKTPNTPTVDMSPTYVTGFSKLRSKN